MAEVPKRIWVQPDYPAWGWVGDRRRLSVGDTPFVRADIADGYRAALEQTQQHLMSLSGPSRQELCGMIREALAKGDEG